MCPPCCGLGPWLHVRVSAQTFQSFWNSVGNGRCSTATHPNSRKPLFCLCRRKWSSPPCVTGGSRLGGTFLFCIQNHLYFQTAFVHVCVPSVKNLVCKCILFVFCLEFKLQCGLILQIDVCCAICARGSSKHLEGAISGQLFLFSIMF